jgi:hypothetical protein
MSEHLTQNLILKAISRGVTRLFRNNTGQGWTGSRIINNRDGSITIFDPRPLNAGLIRGSSDLIGWTTRNGVAVFTAIEVKSDVGRLTPDQKQFILNVQNAGGLAGMARSVDDAAKIVGV